MKKLILTHFLLNIYILALLQPSLPILEYIVNYDYIINELCENRDKPILTCNGKCYLGDQVEKQQKLDSQEQIPMPPKMDLEKLISLPTLTIDETLITQILTKVKPIFSPSIKEQLFDNFLLRPPQL